MYGSIISIQYREIRHKPLKTLKKLKKFPSTIILTVQKTYIHSIISIKLTCKAITRDLLRLLVKQQAKANKPGGAWANILPASEHLSAQAAKHSTHPNSSIAAFLALGLLGPVADGGVDWDNWTPLRVSSSNDIPSAGGVTNSCTKLENHF